jgi:arsenate reductase (thioredoxin)
MSANEPTVLFVCVHNAGRSQMAAGFARARSSGRVRVLSGGSEPADRLNPVAVEAMAEVGIDIAGIRPQVLQVDDVRASDVVITMGCGDTCPYFPGKRYEDWELTDPAGQPIDVVRTVRDDIKTRIDSLVDELLSTIGTRQHAAPSSQTRPQLCSSTLPKPPGGAKIHDDRWRRTA